MCFHSTPSADGRVARNYHEDGIATTTGIDQACRNTALIDAGLSTGDAVTGTIPRSIARLLHDVEATASPKTSYSTRMWRCLPVSVYNRLSYIIRIILDSSLVPCSLPYCMSFEVSLLLAMVLPLVFRLLVPSATTKGSGYKPSWSLSSKPQVSFLRTPDSIIHFLQGLVLFLLLLPCWNYYGLFERAYNHFKTWSNDGIPRIRDLDDTRSTEAGQSGGSGGDKEDKISDNDNTTMSNTRNSDEESSGTSTLTRRRPRYEFFYAKVLMPVKHCMSFVLAILYPIYNITKRLMLGRKYFSDTSYYVNYADISVGMTVGLFMHWTVYFFCKWTHERGAHVSNSNNSIISIDTTENCNTGSRRNGSSRRGGSGSLLTRVFDVHSVGFHRISNPIFLWCRRRFCRKSCSSMGGSSVGVGAVAEDLALSVVCEDVLLHDILNAMALLVLVIINIIATGFTLGTLYLPNPNYHN